MNAATAARLLELNHQFYQTFAVQFSATRQRVQPGVRRIVDELILPLPAGARLLDLGCGNGELGRSLTQRGFDGSYLGLDFSPGLLEAARAALPPDLPSQTQLTYLPRSLAEPAWADDLPGAPFDLILSLAVFHHLPGEALRRQVVTRAGGLLAPGGRMVVSVWQFLNSLRLAARIQPWEAAGLHPDQVDPGDYLLDWRQGGQGLRYVHHFSPAELAGLAAQAGLQVHETFLSDGATGDLGLYQIWG